MTGAIAAASLVLPVASAFLLLQATLRVPRVLLVSLAIVVGFGLGSLTFTVTLFLLDGSLPFLWALDLGALAIALSVFLRRQRLPAPPVDPGRQSIDWVLLSCLVLAVATAAAIFIVNSIATPHGEWDAWAIWNMRARFLYQPGAQWRAAFDERLAWSHPDYPLLLPTLVARVWRQLGSTPTVVPATIAFLFTAATLGVLYGALSMLRSRSQALIGGLCLVGTATFVQAGATQLADLPVGCFLLATCALLAVHRRRGDRASAFWAGFLCGMAAWTKNEGALLVACVFAVAGLRMLHARRIAWPEASTFLLGLMPSLVVWGIFKAEFATRSYLLEQRAGQALAQILNPGRYLEIGYAFLVGSARLGSWLGLALVAYALLMGRTRDENGRRAGTIVASVLALMLVGFFAVYVVTPEDLAWQLEFSLSRLLLQLWPSALLAFFLVTAAPAEVISSPSSADRGAARSDTPAVIRKERSPRGTKVTKGGRPRP